MQPEVKNDLQWMKVLNRSTVANGQFVYAVKSTGVFCRPSCPSRRPRRENVEFFASAALAQQAGYRACYRCLPTAPDMQLQMVEAGRLYLEENLENTVTLKTLARHVGVSPFYFQRLFKRTLGMSPRQYQHAHRASKFKKALRGAGRITDAVFDAGYSSSSRAYDNIPSQLGMTPTAFRSNGKTVEIRYSIQATKLGKMLIAATDRGLCSVRFGETESALAAELRREFQAAQVSRDETRLRPLAKRVCGLLRDDPIAPVEIPLDIQGTAFQQKVWRALRAIPRGQTRSYGEMATAIGKPKAVRAVASACAANPVAVVVPCHRVARKDGGLSGYRWGAKRKAALLRNEGFRQRQGAKTASAL